MKKKKSYYLYKLQEAFSLKQRANPSYSLRAFARDLELNPATISMILNGERELPLKYAQQVTKNLRLSSQEIKLFLESLNSTKSKIDKIKIKNNERFIIDESYCKVIAEWEHYTVLSLFDLDNFICNENEVAARLSITLNRAQIVLENLVTSGLLVLDKKEYKKTHHSIKTTEDISSEALKISHQETLEMGIKKISEVEISLRDFSAMTVAMDPKKLPILKSIIREFYEKVDTLLQDGDKSEIYQLAIQLYPLTNKKK